MGDPQDPAVIATDVQVTLAWSDLLDRKIRLVTVTAKDLMVRPSRWPASNKPQPKDYRFLDPWLPQKLQLQTGQYVSDGGDSYPISKLLWQRRTDGSATANWSEARPAGEVTVLATLKSLANLLQLDPIELALNIAVVGKPDSPIMLKTVVQPGTTSAYAMQVDLQAGELSAHITASGQKPWQLPDQSETTVPLLDTKLLSGLLNSYREPRPEGELTEELAATLPDIELPTHRGHVAIDLIRMDDEVGEETSFDFSSSEHGLQVSELTSSGATGIATGELGVISDEQGWAVHVDATMAAREGQPDMAPQLGGSDWLWRNGRAKLNGKGNTVDSLLNSLQGDLSLTGHFNGKNKIPVAIEARLDNRPADFAFENLAITLGELQINGTAMLSGSDRRKLTMDLKGTHMDLGFLFDNAEIQPLPGVALPEYLALVPDLDLDVTLNAENLQAPGLNLAQASVTLERTQQRGRLVATARDTNSGSIDVTLDAKRRADKATDVELAANFTDIDIPDIFKQKGLLNSRSTGNLTFRSKGNDMKNVFTAMQGTAKVAMEIRSDNNWQRAAIAQEKLSLTGSSSLIVDNNRIVGVKIRNLDIDSIDQDLNGSLVLATDRSPWLVAKITSEKLNVTALQALLPESTAKADQSGLVPSLKRLGEAKISLDAKSLTVSDTTLSDVQLTIASAPKLMTIEQFDFTSEDLTLKTKGKITWQDNRAKLESTAQLTNMDLDQFLLQHRDVKHVPVSGTVQLLSEGSEIDELISNATGFIELQGDGTQQSAAPQDRRKLTMKATRLADGMQADITSLQWGESELAGSVSYHRTSPPSVEVEIHRGTLSLLPWENAHLNPAKENPEKPAKTGLGSIAKTSADFIGNILLTPLKFLTPSDGPTTPRERVFSADPLPLDSLKNLNVKISGKLDALLSTVITAKDNHFKGNLTNGRLVMEVSSGELGDGKGEIMLALDSSAAPPSLELTSTVENMRGLTNRNTFPRSGFVALKSRGNSQAELAANTSGLIFLELGAGPFNDGNSALLTASLVTTMLQTLIPGINRQQHQMECGTTVALFENGKGNTPFGFAARTNQANLLGGMSVDLGKETLEMNIDARGRQGLGIDMGTIFSNTVQIRGRLNNPKMVPNPTGLALRTWAAVSTGGLSILGETLLKRVWASDNPCTSVKRIMVERLCPTNPIAASSQMVCPKV